jgi:hypothetical protein
MREENGEEIVWGEDNETNETILTIRIEWMITFLKKRTDYIKSFLVIRKEF